MTDGVSQVEHTADPDPVSGHDVLLADWPLRPWVLAALLAGRRWQGWRGRRATRWLYVGAVLLLLAYVGSRFVFEVLLARGSN